MTLLDARALRPGVTVEAHVCVVGAGAAGITLARELARSRLDVCLLESGGPDHDPAARDLSRGELVGAPYCRLEDNRERGLGGTTHRWAGWCRPLDALDFRARAWVPGSGWPIGGEDLAPYYRRAAEVCEIPPPGDDGDGPALPLDPARVVTRAYRLSPPTRFGARYRNELAASRHVRLVLHATAIEIETDTLGRSVARVHARGPGGRPFTIAARRYVLAAGGIENTRLLLASHRTHAAGLGNAHDLVGRYFMEHIHFPSGWVRVAPGWRGRVAAYRLRRRSTIARLALSPHAQEREGLLGWNASLESPSRGRAAVGALRRRDGGGPRWHEALRGIALPLQETVEPRPNPASRITLGTERDALGVPRVRLDWRPCPEERATCRRARALLDEALRQAGLGRLDVAVDDDETWPPPPLQGTRGHHMGTTRMSDDPRHGVVDPHGRVHGIDNLYISGSSVFPTGGAGTPTLTIVALALRLADDLAARGAG